MRAGIVGVNQIECFRLRPERREAGSVCRKHRAVVACLAQAFYREGKLNLAAAYLFAGIDVKNSHWLRFVSGARSRTGRIATAAPPLLLLLDPGIVSANRPRMSFGILYAKLAAAVVRVFHGLHNGRAGCLSALISGVDVGHNDIDAAC